MYLEELTGNTLISFVLRNMGRFLNLEDKEVMDAIIQRFGSLPKADIVEAMHQEDAYTETAPGDIIQFKYARTLSLS